MDIKIYKISSKQGHDLPGYAYLMFINRQLNAVSWEFNRPLKMFEKRRLRDLFPFDEHDLNELSTFMNVSELKNKTAHEKLRAFCMYYKAMRGTPYTPKQQEKANIKNVVVTDSLLETYFKNDAFPLNYSKSINDYIKHYNHIRDLNKNGAPSKYPNEYSATFEKTLQPGELQEYWKHLRQLGYKKNERGAWVRPQ